MTYQDLVVTPIYLLIIYLLAYLIRGSVSDKQTKRYFIPALTVKIIGAISVGLIYQFYYSGGDTFNYFHHGSRHIWEAFLDSPNKAILLRLSYLPASALAVYGPCIFLFIDFTRNCTGSLLWQYFLFLLYFSGDREY